MFISWMCQQCGWMNDNNPRECRRCGGDTKFQKGKEIVTTHRDDGKIKEFDASLAKRRSV